MGSDIHANGVKHNKTHIIMNSTVMMDKHSNKAFLLFFVCIVLVEVLLVQIFVTAPGSYDSFDSFSFIRDGLRQSIVNWVA